MSNVLNEEKQKQVVALGQLGWSLRQIQNATGVRRETAAGYLKAAGIALRPPRGWGKKPPVSPANPANGVTTDSAPSAPTEATPRTVPTGGPPAAPAKTASLCEPYRTLIDNEAARGRNAMAIWQHLVDRYGFAGSYQSVKRFLRKQAGPTPGIAHPVIETAPGEDYGESGVMVRTWWRSASGTGADAHMPLLGTT